MSVEEEKGILQVINKIDRGVLYNRADIFIHRDE